MPAASEEDAVRRPGTQPLAAAGPGEYNRKKQEGLAMDTIRPGRWRHFKGGEYEVLGVALHSETQEPMVVYRALYGERGLWVRPASMWNETVTRNGETLPRFTYLGEGGR
jgi:hypothetical protein